MATDHAARIDALAEEVRQEVNGLQVLGRALTRQELRTVETGREAVSLLEAAAGSLRERFAGSDIFQAAAPQAADRSDIYQGPKAGAQEG
jgi:uncharacterized protein Yka (UPF0111/DUF47 family)